MKFMIRKQHEPKVIELISVCLDHIATGMIVAYILNLYNTRGMSRLSYAIDNNKSRGHRFVILGRSDNLKAIWYFQDRSPGLVENEIMAFADKQMPCSFEKDEIGFNYIKSMEED